MSPTRDDFSAATKAALAARAGHRCSICKTPTIGPSDESALSVTNIGVAAHITAAAPGRGARRYDPILTPEQRSSPENGIHLCQTCSVIIDRDAVRFSIDTLRAIKRDHTEFARLGEQADTEVGLIAIGPKVVAGGQIVRFNTSGIVVHLSFFLEGSADDLFTFVRDFDALTHHSRYALLSAFGLGGVLAEAPEVSREGVGWTVAFNWLPFAPRRDASKLKTLSRHTLDIITGEECWKELFESVLGQPPGTWFGDMKGGSHLSELYQVLRGSTWFEHLVKCELVRLSCVPAPRRRGSTESKHPAFQCVNRVFGVRIPDMTLKKDRLRVEVDFELEGYGRWSGDLDLFIYSSEVLRVDRSKAAWTSENIRRMDKEGRVLPSAVPPEGWDMDDGFPD